MSLCVFFEGTGQGVAGRVTNVTRMRDLCHESSRQRFHLKAGSGTRFGSYIGGGVARRAVSMRVRDGGNVRNDGALAVDTTPSLRSCAHTHTHDGGVVATHVGVGARRRCRTDAERMLDFHRAEIV